MSLALKSWELSLTKLAQQAQQSEVLRFAELERAELDKAYQYCADVAQEHSKSFYLASSLLPAEQKRAAHALYAFCRTTDDIVDEVHNQTTKAKLLNWWRSASTKFPPSKAQPILYAWADAQSKFHIPVGYARQLIDGIALDISTNRYETFDDLCHYCYGVASTVGLMVMHITGYQDESALDYAIKLGIALQLTNIMRDVGEDWQRNRLYFAREELAAYGIDEDYIERGIVDDRWREFMKFQIRRARQFYREAEPGIQLLEKEGRFAILAAARLYEGILDDIEKHDYDVFSRRAYVSKFRKLKMLPKIWWEAQ